MNTTEAFDDRKALLESEARYRLAVDAAQLGTWTWDVASDLASFDARVKALFGFESDHPHSRPDILVTRVHADDRERVTQALSSTIDPNGTGRYEAEFCVVHPDGSQRWARASGQMQFEQHGDVRRPVRLIGAVLDITEHVLIRRRIEREALSLERLQSVTSALGEAITTEDVGNVIIVQGVEALGAHAGALGMLTDEGEVVELIRHVGYPDELMDQFQRIPVNGSFPLTDVARSAQPVFLESLDAYLNRYPTLVDTVSHLSGTKALAVIPLTLGARVFGAIAFSFPQERAFDADSRAFMATLALQCAQALERARLYTLENAARLRVERERADLETVLEVVPIGIGISNDPDCRIIRVNPAFAAHLGLDPSVNASKSGPDAEQLPFIVRKEGRTIDAHELPMQRAATEGVTIRDAEFEVVHADGRVVRLLEYAAPLYDNTGKIRGSVGAFVDVTEREELLQRERDARAEAENANLAKSDFLATMSHELRTPLNAIGGYAELLELGIHGPITDEQQKALARIQTSQRHLLGLINQVLNYTRLEAGSLHYERTDVSIDEILGKCDALTAPQILARGLTLRCLPFDVATQIFADGEKVQQILLNLLSNAIKFSASGSTITIAVREDVTGVCIDVADTGIGIPEAMRTRIFEPFVQVDARLTRANDGLGLGLAISRDLARHMDGDITLGSNDHGSGSVFTLRLPRRRG